MASYIPASLTAIAIVFSALLVWLYGSTAFIKRQDFHNWNTESNGLIMPREKKVDMVMLGTSHGRTFSRSSNHQRVEKLLNCEIVNLSRGGGAGIVPMLMDLEKFFDQGNHASIIVYFIDPWVLYSSVWNEDNFLVNPYFFKEEPFSVDYSLRILKYGGEKAFEKYLHAKLKMDWLCYEPQCKARDDNYLKNCDCARVKRRLAALYSDSVQERSFLKYSSKLEDLTKLCASKGAKLVLVVPPTLLGKEPGHATTIAFLKFLKGKYSVPFFDFSQSIEDPKLFRDQDHLNTEGVMVFAKVFLKPTLSPLISAGIEPESVPCQTPQHLN